MASRLEDLIREHAERLEQLAGPIDLTDVTSGARNITTTVMLNESEPTATRSADRHRWPIVAIAAALVAIAVGGLMLAVGNDDSTVEVPADPPTTNIPTTVAPVSEETVELWDRRAVVQAALSGVGFLGLPRVGAQPSTPARGDAVLSIGPCDLEPNFDGLTVYEDGRLIWAVSGYLVEQRLTPQGVELMRSELLGSGLLEPRDNGESECIAGRYAAHTYPDGQWAGDGFEVSADSYIVQRLTDPASWLPASAWEDREIKAFVPSEYGIFLKDIQPSVLASGLSAAAQEVVLAKSWEAQMNWDYTAFTTDEARAFAEALDAAGYEAGVGQYAGGTNAYHLQYRPSEESTTQIDFFPRLPHTVSGGPRPGP